MIRDYGRVYPADGKLPSRITKTSGLKLPWISLWQREEDVSHGSLVIDQNKTAQCLPLTPGWSPNIPLLQYGANFRIGGDAPATHENALQRDRKPVDE